LNTPGIPDKNNANFTFKDIEQEEKTPTMFQGNDGRQEAI
jgi:hypothetical protein